MPKNQNPSSLYDTAAWQVKADTIQADGSRIIEFENGMKCTVVPIPPEREVQISKSMCAVNYNILARISSEKRKCT